MREAEAPLIQETYLKILKNALEKQYRYHQDLSELGIKMLKYGAFAAYLECKDNGGETKAKEIIESYRQCPKKPVNLKTNVLGETQSKAI